MVISILLTAFISSFVLYCLFNGSHIKTETVTVRKTYWILTGLTIAFVMYCLSDGGIVKFILCMIISFMGIIYSCIPSGYDEKGIYLRGLFIPYRNIENIMLEYVKDTYRLNFMSHSRQFFLEVKDTDYELLDECNRLYKKERNR